MSQMMVLIGGIGGGFFAIVFVVWATIAIRDPKSWCRRMFEYLPKIITSGAEHLVDRGLAFVQDTSGQGHAQTLSKTAKRSNLDPNSEFDGEFWADDFVLPKSQVKKYAGLAAAMPPG